MSAEASGYVWKWSPYRGVTLLVHLAIADVVNDLHDERFWMSVGRVAKKARVSTSKARDAIHELVRAGYLELVREAETAEYRPNTYRFLFKGIPAVEGATPATGVGLPPPREESTPATGDRSQVGSQVVQTKGERAKKNTAWHTVPETELLTPKRREIAREVGLHPARVVTEWQKFSAYHFPKPKVDVDATWRNWCVRALDDAWTPPPDPKPRLRQEPEPPYFRRFRAGDPAPEPAGPTRLGDILTKVAPKPPEDDTLGL